MAFQEKSEAKCGNFSLFLYLAILSHYSAIFFALAVGCMRWPNRGSELPRKIVVAWAAGKPERRPSTGFYTSLTCRRSEISISSWAMPFDLAYFRPGREGLFTFTREHTWIVFLFLFENHYIALALLLLWIAAVAILFVRDIAFRDADSPRSRHAGLLLLLPSSRFGARHRRILSLRGQPPHSVSRPICDRGGQLPDFRQFTGRRSGCGL